MAKETLDNDSNGVALRMNHARSLCGACRCTEHVAGPLSLHPCLLLRRPGGASLTFTTAASLVLWVRQQPH
jgi:hypothetical protein